MIHSFRIVHKISRDLNEVPGSIKLLCFAFFTYYLSWGLIQPYIPIFINSRVANYSQVGMVFSAIFLFYGIFSLPIGHLIELTGRRMIMMISFFHYVLIGPLYTMAYTLQSLFLVRVYNALAAAGVWVPFKTYARDMAPPHKEAEIMGLFQTSVHTALVAGALASSLLVMTMPIEYLFYSLMIFPVIAIFITARLPESVKAKERFVDGVRDSLTKTGYLKRDFRRLMSNMLARKTAVLYFMAYFVTSSLTMVLALFAQDFGAELWQIGIIYAGFFLPTISAFVWGDLADNHGRNKVLNAGLVAACIFLFIMSLTSNIAHLFGVVLLVALSMAAVIPVAESIVSKIAGSHKGDTTAMFEALSALGMTAGPLISGFVADVFSLASVFILLSVLMFTTTLIMKNVKLD